MSLENIFTQFDQAVNWNAALYLSHKIIFIFLSATLFTTLSTNDYALWANINSLIFLFLLWIDCGMRKSVPRFCLQFNSISRFITGVVTVQLFILLISIPWMYCSLEYIVSKLHPQIHSICYWGLTVFITQAIVNIIRSLFHSYFLNKQFNLLAIIIMIAEMVCNLFLLFFELNTTTILYTLFISKTIADLLLIIIGIPMFIQLLPTITRQTSQNSSATQDDTIKRFFLYSCTMWIATLVKSFTERNFLVPFITHALNPDIANIFKLSNDIALVFYRFILKTIGTADTSLLTRSSIFSDNTTLNAAFAKLITKVTHLCFFALTLIMAMNICNFYLFNNGAVFQLFIIIVVCYLIEALLLPFERIMEIKENYFCLLIGHIPYIVIIVLFVNHIIITTYGIVTFIVLIHIVRLTSGFLITRLTYKKYNLCFPFAAITNNYKLNFKKMIEYFAYQKVYYKTATGRTFPFKKILK